MANTQTLQGNWNEIKGKIQEKWGEVTNSELDQLAGKTDQIVGMIQRKTGEAQADIKRYVDSLSESGASALNNASDTVREYAASAMERTQHVAADAKQTAEEMAGKVSDQAQAGYIEAQRVVRDRPAESLAVCFGVGVLVGVIGGLVLRSSR